jgi:SAM-dependent methyltransferase
MPLDAVSFYSDNAVAFHNSYRADANRQERLRVWGSFLDRHAHAARSAYDLGCGSGILACELARRGITTVGIDGASGMLSLARQAARRAGLHNVTFQRHVLPVADVAAFPPADLVISSSAIEYMEPLHQTLMFVRRLLHPGGRVIFSVSNRTSWSRKAARFTHRFVGYPGYLGLIRHFMTIDELRTALGKAGLVYVEHEYFGASDRINRALRRVVSAPRASNMIIVVASRPE